MFTCLCFEISSGNIEEDGPRIWGNRRFPEKRGQNAGAREKKAKIFLVWKKIFYGWEWALQSKTVAGMRTPGGRSTAKGCCPDKFWQICRKGVDMMGPYG